MRKLTASYVATSVAIALASTAALAQLQSQPVNPGANANTAPTGSATASGTAAGNSSRGIEAGSQNLGTVNPSSTNLGNTALVPGVIVGGTTGFAGTAGGVNANGERVGIVVADEPTPPTPLFELTARQGAEREARRRARGEEPRIYGIAPRTDRDLTHQMPDDPIIRY